MLRACVRSGNTRAHSISAVHALPSQNHIDSGSRKQKSRSDSESHCAWASVLMTGAKLCTCPSRILRFNRRGAGISAAKCPPRLAQCNAWSRASRELRVAFVTAVNPECVNGDCGSASRRLHVLQHTLERRGASGHALRERPAVVPPRSRWRVRGPQTASDDG